ncbi:MAG: hypothetical protein IPK75_12625 [Acidobacteria bacterium]|nr:hypothetical protein [Acidobacteriota bacterium]
MTLVIDLRSPEERRAAAIADTEEARAAEARLQLLATHKAATAGALESLEQTLKARMAPHVQRKVELRRAIEFLEALESETDDAIVAVQDDLAPAIAAAEADAAAADLAHWEAWKAARQ